MDRPTRRADCLDGPRPCLWVSCRHHLGLRVTASGEVRITFPDEEGDGVDVDGMRETCALDVADRGPLGVAEIGELLGLSAARVNAVAERAMRKCAAPLEGHREVRE